MTNVDEMKLGVLAYWRYCRQHIMGAIECNSADVLTVTKALLVTETEVKVSIADLQREIKTKFYKHRRMVMGEERRFLCPLANYFYFVVPEELQEKALVVCQERYPYAGLLTYKNGMGDIYHPNNIDVVKTAKRFKLPKPDIKEILQIGYAASNTAIRYGNKLMARKEEENEEKN